MDPAQRMAVPARYAGAVLRSSAPTSGPRSAAIRRRGRPGPRSGGTGRGAVAGRPRASARRVLADRPSADALRRGVSERARQRRQPESAAVGERGRARARARPRRDRTRGVAQPLGPPGARARETFRVGMRRPRESAPAARLTQRRAAGSRQPPRAGRTLLHGSLPGRARPAVRGSRGELRAATPATAGERRLVPPGISPRRHAPASRASR